MLLPMLLSLLYGRTRTTAPPLGIKEIVYDIDNFKSEDHFKSVYYVVRYTVSFPVHVLNSGYSAVEREERFYLRVAEREIQYGLFTVYDDKPEGPFDESAFEWFLENYVP